MSDDAKKNLDNVEDKVATAEDSMTNRIMFVEVMVAGEKRMNTQPQQSSQNINGQKIEGQDMTENMDFHKSRDVITSRRLTWVRPDLKIIVYPTVTTKGRHYSTSRSMITIDSDEKNNSRKRSKKRTSRSLTGTTFGTKRLGGV